MLSTVCASTACDRPIERGDTSTAHSRQTGCESLFEHRLEETFDECVGGDDQPTEAACVAITLQTLDQLATARECCAEPGFAASRWCALLPLRNPFVCNELGVHVAALATAWPGSVDASSEASAAMDEFRDYLFQRFECTFP